MADQLRAHFETALRQMPTGVVIAEAPSGRILMGNEQLAAVWRQPFTAADVLDWYRQRVGYHADGRKYTPEEWPIARSLRTGEVIEGEEIEIVRGDGTRGTVRASSSPVLDSEGRIVAAVATVYDVTEQKRQEVARRFLSEASSLLAGSLDYETTLQNVARLAVPTLADWCSIDISRENGRIDRLATEHVQAEKARLAREIARRFPWDPDAPAGVPRVIRTGVSELIPEVTDELLQALAHDEEQLRLLRSAGMTSAMVVPLGARGRTLGAIVFASAESGRTYGPPDLEVAEELAVRAALAIDNAMLYRQAQAASRAKSDFLAVVSHELRTPLTAVIGYAELLSLGVPDPLTDRQREQVERIEVSASHLLMLIEEILTVISLDSGELRLRAERFTLDEVLSRADTVIRPLADAKRLRLSIPAAPTTLESDPDRLLQVLLNLLSNAVKFTEEGEVSLHVDGDDDAVEITVRDSGVGLTDEHIHRIFDPFWQVEQPITRKVGGTGLGLTISRGLAERLGGSMRVRSEPGRGSEFTVRIPLRLPSSSGTPPRATAR